MGSLGAALPLGLRESTPVPPGLDPAALEWLSDRLVSARRPALVVDYSAVTPEAFAALQRLAGLLEAPVVDCGARLNYPTDDRLNFTNLASVLEGADLVVGFEVEDRYGQAVRYLGKTEFVHVGARSAALRKNSYESGVGSVDGSPGGATTGRYTSSFEP